MKLAVVSLGCTKNQVDSEMIIAFFKNQGFSITTNLEEAKIILINTCGFIEDAKKEAIDTILDMADYKINGNCKHLFVFGCLAKRYKKEILESMPEVDLVVGVDEYDNLSGIISSYFNKAVCGRLDFKNRTILSNFPTCYIRISDGCNNNCAYCAIPSIRGKFKSRNIEDILDEVRYLAKEGMQEFVIISQDTSKYGEDIYGKPCLDKLLREISKVEGVKWIRILYMYLYEISDELLEEIKNNDKVCKYFDIPVQHISDKMLKAMNRKDNKKLIYERIEKIRKNIPEAILRTTIIVGFPGETDEDFNELMDAVREIKFDKMGAFTFSPEEGTIAIEMEKQVDENIKKQRLDTLLKTQKKISLEKNKKYVGKRFEVLVDDVSEDNLYFSSRTYMDAPDVDEKVLIKIDDESNEKIIVGEFANVEIISCSEYDLFAKVL